MVSDGVRADAPHWLNREPQQVFRPLDLLVMWRLYMKYVVRVTGTNPDGGTCGTQYVLCDTERDMERMINAFKDGHDYTTVTCLGPLVELPKWMKDIVGSYT